MNSSTSSLALIIAEHGLSFAVQNARDLDTMAPDDALDAIIWQADRILAPTSESSLWGMFRGDDNEDLASKAAWWANVYAAAIATYESDDPDAYDDLVLSVHEGNGDRYQ